MVGRYRTFLRDNAGKRFYEVEGGKLKVRRWDGKLHPIDLPDGVVRFHLARRTLEPVFENDGASLFHLDDGVRLVEFHTKANALDADCMAVVAKAAADPGPGILVHNDAQHFSAGVNLERFKALIETSDWDGIDQFLIDFQTAVASLRYCNAPVVGAPSGLAIGGGYEVLAHCDMVVAHANSVLGLVESVVGLVPGGGGVKETYWRWYQATGDWEKAARKTFNQVGYGLTASSPDEAAKLQYFIPERDRQVMNRDRLVETGQGGTCRICSRVMNQGRCQSSGWRAARRMQKWWRSSKKARKKECSFPTTSPLQQPLPGS